MRPQTVAGITSQRVIGVVRAASADEAYETASRLVGAGLRAVEVSLTTPAALTVVARLAAERPAAVIGAGTVLDAAAAARAAEAGARFVVSPACSPAVIATAHRHGLVAVPGILTATELVAALEAGADLVKLFPASALTPRVVGDLLGPFPQARLVPTGGIAVSEAAAWIAAGAVAVGLGSALGRGTADEVTERVGGLLAGLAAARVDGTETMVARVRESVGDDVEVGSGG